MTTKNTINTILRPVLFLVIALYSAVGADAQQILRKDSVALERRRMMAAETVIIDKDTVSIILPEYNFGRYDRGLFNYLYVPKGTWAFGMTASYGELNTEDIRVLDIMKNFDFGGKIYSIKPTVSYFVRHNQSVGIKLSYTRGEARLDGLDVDFDDDLNFSLKDVSYVSESFAMGTFYRNYVGLDRGRRFGVFNEIDLMFQTGNSSFKRLYNGEPRDTHTTVTQASLNLSPGLCVFIQQNVAFNVSFGVFGVKFQNERQTTNGTDEGSRFTSGANFRFNIFNINFGLMVAI